MEKEENMVKINCILKGQTALFFEEIKRSKGLENNTEVIRVIISEYYRVQVKVA